MKKVGKPPMARMKKMEDRRERGRGRGRKNLKKTDIYLFKNIRENRCSSVVKIS